MGPYRARPSQTQQPSSLDYGRFEQLCIYVLIAIAVVALAFAEIKIP